MMRVNIRHVIPLVSVVVLASCGARPISDASTLTTRLATTETSLATTTSSPSTTTALADTTTSVPSVFDENDFGELDPVRYWVDPDYDPTTPMKVFFTVPGAGWSAWTGAFKNEAGQEEFGRYVGVSIIVVNNLVRDACRDHTEADPPVGTGVDDLADALVNLEPFLVTASPEEVTAFGYDGLHLELTVPELFFDPQRGEFFWPECNEGLLRSWIAPVLSYAFWGYSSPGQIEEYWILDVEGTRLMITANRSPDSPQSDIAELQALLDSIEIAP